MSAIRKQRVRVDVDDVARSDKSIAGSVESSDDDKDAILNVIVLDEPIASWTRSSPPRTQRMSPPKPPKPPIWVPQEIIKSISPRTSPLYTSAPSSQMTSAKTVDDEETLTYSRRTSAKTIDDDETPNYSPPNAHATKSGASISDNLNFPDIFSPNPRARKDSGAVTTTASVAAALDCLEPEEQL